MAALTIKNVPDVLYEHLKDDATRSRRSLNQETIRQLLDVAPDAKVGPSDAESEAALLDELRAFREVLARRGVWISAAEVDESIDEGRP